MDVSVCKRTSWNSNADDGCSNSIDLSSPCIVPGFVPRALYIVFH